MSTTPPGTVQTTPNLQLPTAIDYTSKDWASLVQSMLSYGSVIMPDWNQASEGDFGVALVELFAYMGDILSYYGDRIGQEAYLPTATQRLSLLNIAQLLGYKVSNGTPATGTVTFQSSVTSPQITIPQGTQVATSFQLQLNQPVIYQTTEAATCPAAGGTVTVPVSQGITYTMQQIGVSTGLPGLSLQIPQTGILDGSVSVFVQTAAGSEQWTEIDFIVDAGPDDMVWTSSTDANGFTTIIFGDNVNGTIPSVGLTVWATYTVGVGAAGNVAAGTVGLIYQGVDGLFIPTNADGSYQSSIMTGGSDPESNDHIRAAAPASFQTQQRAVSPQDFQSLVMAVPGVTAASVVTNHSTSVTLYVLGPSYQVPSQGLIDDITNFFKGKTLAGVTVTVGVPTLVPINVGASGDNVIIQVADNYRQSSVLANVQVALSTSFQPPSTSFGQLITLSSVMSTIVAVPGVVWCSIDQFSRTDNVQATTDPIQLRAFEIAVPGTFYLSGLGGL